MNNSYKTYTDEKLWALFIENDKQAFTILYHRYKLKVYHFFYARLYQNKETAKDFTQALFLKLIENKEKFNANYTFKTWVYNIANNMCKNHYRKNETIRNSIQEITETQIDNILIDSHRFKVIFNGILLELKEENLEIFLLRYQAHLSIKEISKITSTREGTVKSKLFYTIKKMAKELKGFEHINYKTIDLWKK